MEGFSLLMLLCCMTVCSGTAGCYNCRFCCCCCSCCRPCFTSFLHSIIYWQTNCVCVTLHGERHITLFFFHPQPPPVNPLTCSFYSLLSWCFFFLFPASQDHFSFIYVFFLFSSFAINLARNIIKKSFAIIGDL